MTMSVDLDTSEWDNAVLPRLLSTKRNFKKSRDPRDVRLAAVASAIVETANERRVGGDDNTNTATTTTTTTTTSASEVFAASLTALEGTLLRTDHAHANDGPQFPLLQILERCVPHVPASFFWSQFELLSRLLRAATSATKGAGLISHDNSTDAAVVTETADGLGGANAKLRQLVRTAQVSLARHDANSSSSHDRAVLRLFDGTILELFDDRRPKVRKMAHGAAAELARHHVLFGSHVGAYVVACLQHDRTSSNSKNNGDVLVKMLHLLHFTERVVGDCLPQSDRVTVCEHAVRLAVTLSGQDDKDDNTTLLLGSLFAVLTAVMEEEEEHVDAGLAGRVLASLLQLGTTASEDNQTRQARLLVSCCVRLHRSAGARHDDLLAKLLPVTLSRVVVHGCHDRRSAECAGSCAGELNRAIRECCGARGGGKDAAARMLHHTFRLHWDALLPSYALYVVTTHDEEERRGLILQLVALHDDMQDAAAIKAVEHAVGTIVQGVGLEDFWRVVPLDGEEEKGDKNKKAVNNTGIGQHRTWLIPLLSTYSKASCMVRPRLAFFQTTVLGLARKCDGLSGGKGGGTSMESKPLTALEASVARSQCVDMWGLLGGFCTENRPTDMQKSFPRLAQTFTRALSDYERYPQLITIIGSGLETLAKHCYEVANENGDDASAQADLLTLSKMTEKLLPVLFKLVDTLSGSMGNSNNDAMDVETTTPKVSPQEIAQRIHHVTMAIQSLARVTPKEFLQNMFQKLLTRLLKASTSDNTNNSEDHKMSSLLNLAHALTSSSALSPESISLLYRAIRPLIQTDEFSPNVQKRAYRVMSALCQNYTSTLISGKDNKLDEVVELMISSLLTCQIAARSVRLQCLGYVMEGLDSSNEKHMAIIPQMMGEVLLCLKDSNAKTRESSYQLLLTMAKLHQKQKGTLQQFFTIILGALGGKTPQMRSAAVMALSRLVFEFARHDQDVQELLPSLLQTVMVLFDENNAREVVKSVISFVRITVAAMKPWQLEPMLGELLEGLFKYDKGKGRFRSKIKIILKRLVRTYGYEKLSPLVPEGRLVTHMRKMDERAKRRKEALKAQGLVDENAGDFEDMMDSDEDDSDDGRTLMTGVTGFTKMTAKSGKTLRTAAIDKSVKSLGTKTMKSVMSGASGSGGDGDATGGGPRIQKEKAGEVFDLLDASMTKKVHFQNKHDDGDSDFDDNDDDDDSGVMEFDNVGRLVVHDDLSSKQSKHTTNDMNMDDDDAMENSQMKRGEKRLKMSKFEIAKADKAKSSAERSRKKQKAESEGKSLGSEFKSKKAGGDVKRKGAKFEPYAYVPLDGKSYTKKNRGKAVSQMATVVKKGKRKRG